MKELLKEFIKSVIYEMRVINIGEQVPNDHYAIIAYKDKIFKFDDNAKLDPEEFEELFKQLDIKSNPSNIKDINYIGAYIEGRFDILYGFVSNGVLDYEESLISHDPRLSVLVNKVLKQLHLKSVSTSPRESNGKKSFEQKTEDLKKDIQNITWYHGTSTEYLDSILKLGLRPRKFTGARSNFNIKHDSAIFLTSKYSKAHFHAYNATEPSKHKIMIIKIRSIPDPSLIISDYDIDLFSKSENIKSNTLKSSINVGVIGYLGSIPPKFIESFIINVGDNFYPSYKEFTIDDLLSIKRANSSEGSNFSFSEYFFNKT